jgi:hypothetical protein
VAALVEHDIPEGHELEVGSQSCSSALVHAVSHADTKWPPGQSASMAVFKQQTRPGEQLSSFAQLSAVKHPHDPFVHDGC